MAVELLKCETMRSRVRGRPIQTAPGGLGKTLGTIGDTGHIHLHRPLQGPEDRGVTPLDGGEGTAEEPRARSPFVSARAIWNCDNSESTLPREMTELRLFLFILACMSSQCRVTNSARGIWVDENSACL